MKKITKEVGSSSDEMGSVESFELEFSDAEIASIKEAQSIIKEKGYQSIDMDFSASQINHDSDFTPGIETLMVFRDCLYFKVFGKHDPSRTYESEPIDNEELGLN